MAIRQQRIAQLILKEVSQMVQFEIRDPEIGFITLSDVDLSNDFSYCKIFVSFLDKSKSEESQLLALNGYSKQIRVRLGKVLMIKKIPSVQFYIDESFKEGARIDEIIQGFKK